MVLVVALSAPVFGLVTRTAPASADSVSNLRTSIDHVAQQWFDAQVQVQRLDERITAIQQRVTDLGSRARALHLEATARAVDMYVGKPNSLVDVFTEGTALDSARRVELIARANEKSTQTFDALTQLTNELKSQRDALTKQRDAKRAAVGALTRSRSTLDADLRGARAAAARAARAALAARAARVTSVARTGNGAPAAPSFAAAPVAVVAAPAVAHGVHPMHNQPYLACTRNRESRGNYSVVSSSGLYYGAYQFLRTTWDVTAIHAGRSELVGVPPNTASEYDQDDLAWALYQWQGSGPWGGRC
ncbi:MAG: resuscitation-promoting factor RpfB [Actinomycetota bacterium]|jgi:peptidoglycan hydrolase CwlO-like protein|nr:resuscitation-promoting factor RpfB [Actinomycetota bacterium]